MSLITTDWLEKNLFKEDVKILDCSWHMPNTKRIGKDEFLKEHDQTKMWRTLSK